MPITIKKQPSVYTSAITLARNPVIYEFSGCTQSNTYTFKLLYEINSTGQSPSPNIVYASVLRKPDVDNILRVDCSDMLHNILYNELIKADVNYYYPSNLSSYKAGFTSAVYFRAALVEESGETSSTTLSHIGLAMDGYISQGISDDFDTQNYTDNQTYNSDNILLSAISGTNTYEIPFFELVSPVNVYVIKNKLIAYARTSFFSKLTNSYYTSTTSLFIQQLGLNYLNLSSPILYNHTPDLSKPIYVDLFDSGYTLVNRYYFKVKDPCKSPTDFTFITFLNRFGVFERIYFDGKIDKELMTTFDTYKYDSGKRTYHKKLQNAKNKFVVNTGWIQEVKNSQIQDIFLSEILYLGCYYDVSGISTKLVKTVPVILTDTNIRYKSTKNDKLYYYTLTFEEAIDKIK